MRVPHTALGRQAALLLALAIPAAPALASSAGGDPAAGRTVPMQAWTAAPTWSAPAAPDDHIVGTEGRTTASSRSALGVAPLVATPPVLPLTTIAPCRQYDSRSASSLADNTPRAVTLTGAPCGIPTTALAVSVNITVFNIVGNPGNAVFKVDTVSPPATAWINYGPTETQRANAGTVALNGSGAIIVQVNQGAGSVDFVVDVNGYYSPLNTPYLPGAETFGTLTSGSGVIYNTASLNIGNSTRCLVTVQPLIAASFTMGFGLVYPTWRVNGTTTDHTANPWCFVTAPTSGNYYECSTTAVVSPTGSATNTYDFGCSLSLGGNASSGYCHTTVICFP